MLEKLIELITNDIVLVSLKNEIDFLNLCKRKHVSVCGGAYTNDFKNRYFYLDK